MAYDPELADRIRDCLADREDVTEKAMFGGLAFLVAGSMAVTASGQGGLMVRVAPEDTESLLELPGVEEVVMRGRSMRGWVRVATDQVAREADLEAWVHRGVTAAARAAGQSTRK
jgi:hypothetical protein